MAFAFNTSRHRELVRSPHRVLDCSQPLLINADSLSDEKFWPGTIPYWMNIGAAHRGPFALLGVAQRQIYRMRYGLMEVDVTTTDPTFNWSYSSSWKLSSPGFVPVNDGMPKLILTGQVYFPPPPIDPSLFTSADAYVDGGLNYQALAFGAQLTQANGSYTGATVLIGNPTSITVGIAIKSPVLFKDHLAIVSQRVRSRAWPGFLGGITYGEYLGEWDGLSNLVRPNGVIPPFDGQWHGGGPFSQTSPYFGSANNLSLWSGWYWPTLEEGGGFTDIPYSARIRANRCRFKVNSAAPYFIGQATINRLPGTTPTGDGPDSLDTVTIIKRGILLPGAVTEIPWPAKDPGDFVQSTLKFEGAPTLSCGYISFAIVGETVESWVTRTGFSAVG